MRVVSADNNRFNKFPDAIEADLIKNYNQLLDGLNDEDNKLLDAIASRVAAKMGLVQFGNDIVVNSVSLYPGEKSDIAIPIYNYSPIAVLELLVNDSGNNKYDLKVPCEFLNGIVNITAYSYKKANITYVKIENNSKEPISVTVKATYYYTNGEVKLDGCK